MAYSDAYKRGLKIANKYKEDQGRTRTAPTGTLASGTSEYMSGSSGTPFGASGRGEFAEQNDAQTQQAMKRGIPLSEAGNQNTYTPPPPTNASSAAGLAKTYGLSGLNLDKELIGLSPDKARARALQLGQERSGQQSALTSYTFNSQSVAGLKEKFGQYRMKMDDTLNDSLRSKNEKDAAKITLNKSFSDQFASQFQNAQQFNDAAKNPEMLKMLQQYEQQGGSITDITSKIGVSVTGETRNPDGSFATTYSDGTSDNRRLIQNADGSYTSREAMSVDQYLGAMKDPSQKKAFESLIPEQKLAQDEITRQQGIAEEFRDAYFGTEEKVGFIQQEKQQAQERIKLLEREAKLDEKNMRAQANFAIEKNNADLQIEGAKVEENRLAAKNYMTGMLAKLGALNTTGAAPQALAGLEQKYQQQSQQLRTSYSQANRGIEIKLTETVDGIGIERDNNILDIKGDLSKSEQDVWKEIFKLQNDADAKTFKIIGDYTKDFRTQTEKFAKEAKALAEKNAKAFAKIASTYSFAGVREGDIGLGRTKGGTINKSGVATPQGGTRSISSVLEAGTGADGHVSPDNYKDIYDKFIAAGGTRAEFLSKYPAKRWVNPEDNKWLPAFLRTQQPSGTLGKDTTKSGGISDEAFLAELRRKD